MDYIIIISLVILSGLFSGLTLGLLSLDKNELERKISLGNKDAKRVYAVRKRGNLLLCTLLLGNVAVNSTLSIFLGNISSGVVAGLIATSLIVVFGEIIPQAAFSRYALSVGAKMSWLVKVFIFLMFPIAWPISIALDKALGDEMPSIYSKKELIEIVKEHRVAVESAVDADEEKIIEGALSYSNKTAEQVMTPRTVVYALEIDSVLDKKLLEEIKEEGFTRIPVFKETIDDVVGLLYVKDLINIKLGIKVKNLYKKDSALIVSEHEKLDDLLNKFIKSKMHLAFVKNEYNGTEGVVTLEDIIEEIIKREIVDETDKTADLQKEARKAVNGAM